MIDVFRAVYEEHAPPEIWGLHLDRSFELRLLHRVLKSKYGHMLRPWAMEETLCPAFTFDLIGPTSNRRRYQLLH
jgi:hypothetical protein